MAELDNTESMIHSFSIIFSIEAMKVLKVEKPEILERSLAHM